MIYAPMYARVRMHQTQTPTPQCPTRKPECAIADADSVHLNELYGARTALEVHSGDAHLPCAVPEGQKADNLRLVHVIARIGHVIAAPHHGTTGVVRVARDGHASRAHRHAGGDDVLP